MHRLVLCCLIGFLISGCVKEQHFSYNEVNVNSCEQEKIDNETVTLCLDSVLSDSRCPRYSSCVWQGVAQARFIFRVQNTQHKFILSTANLPGYRQDTIIAGYSIRFVDLLPYPGDPPSPAKAIVEISK